MSHFIHHFEENYLKAIYKLSQKETGKANNIALAKQLGLNPATVLEMVRKLSEKKLVQIVPDKTIRLTEKGEKKALLIIRKHRLWEVFLVNKLKYKWNEVHALAEQLEHIDSDDMINRLEEFLGFPAHDPHGDAIPDKNGKIKEQAVISLLNGEAGKRYLISHFAETDDAFLDYLSQLRIVPGTKIKMIEILPYDLSCTIEAHKTTIQLSEKVASNILVTLLH
jgi:DtxR family Mn-dependent transcriptional regulator